MQVIALPYRKPFGSARNPLARAANTPNPNFATLIANCQAAVDQVVSIIALYSTPATPASKAGANLSTLQHMQTTIRGWH